MTEEKKGFKKTDVGLIPEDWEIAKIDSIINEISMGPFGSNIKVSNFVSKGVPVLTGKNVSSERLIEDFDRFVTPEKAKSLNKAVASQGDIVVTHRGTIGQISYIPDNSKFEEYVISQSQFRVRFKDDIVIPEWVVLYFLSEMGSKKLLEGKGHTGVPAIAQATTTFRNLSIPLPPLAEQQAIATALSDVDELIRSLDGLIQKKEAIKKGTMQKLLTPNNTGQASKKRLPGFDGEWEVKALGEVLLSSPDYGINAPAVDYNSNYPTYLRITDISENGNFIQLGKKSVKAVNSDLYYLREGEIVLARTGASTGKSYHYNPKDGELVFAGFLIRIKPDPKKAESKFLKYYLQTDQYWNWVEKNSMRSGQPGLNSVQYSSLKISFPSVEEQKAIAQILSDMDREIQVLRQKREKAGQIKQGMMQQLLTGRIRIYRMDG